MRHNCRGKRRLDSTQVARGASAPCSQAPEGSRERNGCSKESWGGPDPLSLGARRLRPFLRRRSRRRLCLESRCWSGRRRRASSPSPPRLHLVRKLSSCESPSSTLHTKRYLERKRSCEANALSRSTGPTGLRGWLRGCALQCGGRGCARAREPSAPSHASRGCAYKLESHIRGVYVWPRARHFTSCASVKRHW